MRRDHTHTHYCANREFGCQSSYSCDAELERNYDGFPKVICSINPMEEGRCEDCETSICSECGSCLNIEKHAKDCPKATTGDGAAV